MSTNYIKLRENMTDIINSCTSLATDYQKKHNELLTIYRAFKLTVNKLHQNILLRNNIVPKYIIIDTACLINLFATKRNKVNY